MNKFHLKLYIAGHTPNSERAIANIERICKVDLQGMYELHIIDVLENPQLAEDAHIIATPALIKELPEPLRRVIGDLSEPDKVLLGLGIDRPSLTEPNGDHDNK